MDLLLVISTQSYVCETIYIILLGNIDYDTGPYVFTIPAGMTSVTFNVATIINDDNILEENEFFYLTIDSSSLPNDITTGTPLQVSVTITNDDCK